jgi:hypothetical protein
MGKQRELFNVTMMMEKEGREYKPEPFYALLSIFF